jgi:hypothetical protein
MQTKFAKSEYINHITPNESKLKFRKWEKKKIKLAESFDKFGGKRLLGVTDNGTPIWVSYSIDKKTLTCDIALSHSMDTIRKSKLCPRRVTVATGENFTRIDNAMRTASKSDHGEVTQRTLDYIEKLISYNESKIYYEDNKCTTSMFMKISNAIYEGSPENLRVRWTDVMKAWNMPTGKYFNI